MKKIGLIIITLFVLMAFIPLRAQWNQILIPSNNTLYTVDIHESGLCYAAGIDIIKSEDFGATWQEIVFTGPLALYFEAVTVYGIDVVNDSVIVAVGHYLYDNKPVIIRTEDNGLTWTIEWTGSVGYKLRDVEFFDELVGIAVGDIYTLKTTDGGLNWTSTGGTGGQPMYGVSFLSSSIVVVVGSNRILRSTNGGASYVNQTNTGKLFKSVSYDPVANKVQAVYFQSSNNSSYSFTSYDNGLSWTSQLLNDDLIYCNELCSNDTVFYGYENSFRVSYNNGDEDFIFTGYPFEYVYDVTFRAGNGLAVAGTWTDAKVYKYNYSAVPELEQNVDFVVPNDICFGTSTEYIPTHLSLDSYEWIVNGVSVSNDAILNYVHPSAGLVEVKLITGYNGYMDTITKNVTVLGTPVVNPFTMTGTSVICTGLNYTFTVLNLGGQTGFKVLKNGVFLNFSSASGNNRTYNAGSITASTTFEIMKWSINACDSIGTTEIFVLDVETYAGAAQNFYVKDTLVCYADSTQIVVPVPSDGYTYQLLKNGTTVATVTAPFGDTLFIPTPAIIGATQFKLKVLSPVAGCLTNLTTIDSVFVDPVSASFTTGENYFPVYESIPLNTSGVVGGFFEWSTNGSVSVFAGANTLSPTIQFDNSGYADLQLVAESQLIGCKDTVIETLVIFPEPLDSVSKQICWVSDVVSFPEFVLDKHVDDSGHLIVAGYNKFVPYVSYVNRYSGSIQKYDSQGNLIWEWHDVFATSGDNNHSSQFSSIDTDIQGNIYLTGVFVGLDFKYKDTLLFTTGLGPAAVRLPFIMKLDPNGDFVWWITYNITPYLGSGGSGGFSDIVVDHSTNRLYTCLVQNHPAFLFSSGIQSLNSGDKMRIVRMDTAGNFINEFTAYVDPVSDLQPAVPSSSPKDAVISPEIFIGTDHKLYVSGEYFSAANQSFGSYVLSGAGGNMYDRASFIAKLKIDGPGAQGWIGAERTSEFRSFSAWSFNPPITKSTMDEFNNIYQSINWEILSYSSPVINSDTIATIQGSKGASILKFDSDLNYVWHKNFEPILISDIYCGNSEDVYFIGRTHLSNFAHFEDSTPIALIPYNAKNLILGSISVNGNLTWLDQLGQSHVQYADPITGNTCGDVYFSGRCVQNLYILGSDQDFDFELNDSIYGTYNGEYLFKLADSICVVGGCLALCLDTTYFIPPVVTYTDSLLMVSGSYDNYQWYYNGVLISGATNPQYQYNNNGNYTVSVSNNDGCYAEASPDITCLNENLILDTLYIFQIGASLMSPVYNSYQWYYNGNIINGATDQFYDYTQNGQYNVEVTDENGCTIYSVPFVVNDVGFEDQNSSEQIFVYPNPTNSMVNVRFGFNPLNPTFQLYDISGKLCDVTIVSTGAENEYTIDVRQLQSGIYLLKILEGNGEIYMKITKSL